MKKWLLSILAFAIVATTTQATEVEQPYSKLKKQIGIMSNIIETSLSEGNKRNRSLVDVDGVYIKSQGIIFQVKGGRGARPFFNHQDNGLDFDFDVQVAPMAPINVEDFADGQFGEDIGEIVGRSMQVYEEAMESMREHSEYARELKEEQRELTYDVRNYARRQRDLEFEVRHADESRKKELAEQLSELKGEVSKLEKKSDELTQRAQKEALALKQKHSMQAKKTKLARQAYYQQVETSIAETLCDYGTGFRQLDQKELVTFIIDMGQGRRSDSNIKKIHSFSKKDIVACVSEDKTPAQLLKDGNSYYF
ncbi:MAG: hypothetical protein ACI9FJ_003316 [Alteromonadaceae bacterium]|jgi:hypothetical protein